ncbi:hypothetical protein HQ46_08180 [Porphyromonas gulae]|nr:hypothetical protein HQ46_08180 [Porphyromonas gulae]
MINLYRKIMTRGELNSIFALHSSAIGALFSRPLKFFLISDIQQISLRISLLNLQVFLSS